MVRAVAARALVYVLSLDLEFIGGVDEGEPAVVVGCGTFSDEGGTDADAGNLVPAEEHSGDSSSLVDEGDFETGTAADGLDPDGLDPSLDPHPGPVDNIADG